MPALLYFYIKGIKQRKYSYLLLFLLFSTIYSTAYGLVTNVIVIWTVLGLYTCFHFVKYKVDRLFISGYFVLTLLAWLTTNLWWILPLKELLFGQSIFNEKINPTTNLDTLKSLSAYFTLPTAIRLLQLHYFFYSPDIKDFYSNFFAQAFSWVVPLILVLNIKTIFKTKQTYFFIALFIIGLAVSLGSNYPFGPLFVYAFNKITFLQAFRNSYEKFGIVYLLGYAFLFGFALNNITRYKNGLIYVSAFLIAWHIYNLPLYYGDRITNVKVDIPESYTAINNYLTAENFNQRLTVLPLTGEGVSYSWGYSGVEPSLFLLNTPAVSYELQSPIIKDFLNRFNERIESGTNFSAGFSLLNAPLILTRPDLAKTPKANDYFLYTKVPNEAAKIAVNCATINIEDQLISNKNVVSCKTENLDISDSLLFYITGSQNFGEIEINIIDINGLRAIWRNYEYISAETGQAIKIDLHKPSEIKDNMNLKAISYVNIVVNKTIPIDAVKINTIALAKTGFSLVRNDFKIISRESFGETRLYAIENFNQPQYFGYVQEIVPIDSLKTLTALDINLYNLEKQSLVVIGQNVNKELSFSSVIANYENQPTTGVKLNTTKYWLPPITETTGVTRIQLLEAFNPHWLLVSDITQQELLNTPLNNIRLLNKIQQNKPEVKHAVTNGYGNIWELPTDTASNGYGIIFVPQIYANLGTYLSIGFGSLIALVLGFLYFKVERYR